MSRTLLILESNISKIYNNMKVLVVILGIFIGGFPMIKTKYSSYADYSVPRDCEPNDRRPNLLDPHSFYWCLHDGPVLFKCVSGTYFNVTAGKCTPEVSMEVNNPSVDEDTKESITSSAQASSTVIERNDCPQPKVAPKSVKCPAVDPIDRSIYFADPDACGCFYQCDNGVAKRIPCRKDLHFNATTNLCDWPEEAGCEALDGYLQLDGDNYIKLNLTIY